MSDDYFRAMMIEAMQAARGDPLPDNPPPGPKWKAKAGLHRLKLNGSESAVLWCLIDHASAAAGICYPSESRIARLLNIPAPTVRKAIASLKRRGLIAIIERFNSRGRTSNLYLIHWQPLFVAYAEMKLASKVDATPRPKVDATPRPKVDPKPMKGEPRKKNLGHEMVHRPSAADTAPPGKEKKRASKKEQKTKPPSPTLKALH